MALWIRDTSTVPAERWRYPHVAPGKFIVAPNYPALYPEIVKVYTSNNAPVPPQQKVIDWLCANLTIPCVEGNQPLMNRFAMGITPLPPPGCCSKQRTETT